MVLGDYVLKMYLKTIIKAEEEKDYDTRNNAVISALSCAIHYGFTGGIKIDPDEPNWPIVFIELPTGQVSWHIEEYKSNFDGHTTEEKYNRIKKYLENDDS